MTAVLSFQSSIFPSASLVPSSSAAGVLCLLKSADTSEKVKVTCLQRLLKCLPSHWPEICEAIATIEELSEDATFPAAQLAAHLASQCFFHLQEFNEALRLALSAGDYLDITLRDEYTETIISKCIDEYKSLRLQQIVDASVTIDPRMERIIEQMLQRCYRDGCYEQALGVALDTNRIDKVEEVISEAVRHGRESLLTYAFSLCQQARNITPRDFRLAVLELLVQQYNLLKDPDHSSAVFTLLLLNRPREAAQVLVRLLTPEGELMAYQIAFDLLETENQGFLLHVVDSLPAAGASEDADFEERLAKLRRVLTDGLDVDLTLNFLFKQCHAEPAVLREIQGAIEGRSNVLHGATVLAHAFLFAGTTRDQFLRENLDWLGKAKNWAKFSAVASIGVVHKGHVHESMNLLQPYLPQPAATPNSSAYSEAGALYALGLIHANKGGRGDSTTISYLSTALRQAEENEILQHGASLGIGLAAMATGDEALLDMLRSVLFTDSTIAGEGAALGMGLVMLGQSESPLAQSVLPDLLNYLHNTAHEKIIRALSLAIAMMVYGKEESADVIIEQLSRDRDPIVRYGAMFAVAMAYCGTGENKVLRKLLHVAVSDVNDDVRRAAVMAIGFLMAGSSPETVPRLVALLAESFNPHVRYAACLAVGIACAGSGLKEAVDLIAPMLEDAVDFVRQGALLAMAMVLQQVSLARSPAVKKFKEALVSIISSKHQPVLAKAGAILATGILDAGGGNVSINMHSRIGFLKMGGAVGLLMFLQHWYWYPLLPFLSLSFSPTMLIALNKDFNMPNAFDVVCNAPPAMFSYNKAEAKKEDEKKLVATAVLSTTAKAKARELRKEAKKLGKQMSIDSDAPPLERVTSHLSTTSYLSLDAEKPVVAAEAKPKKIKEPSSFQVSNPSRVLPAQLRFLSLSTSHRYVPIRSKAHPLAGIILVRDTDPDAPEDVAKVDRMLLGQIGEDAPPPEPFEWDPSSE